jgi:hypothetical protein
MPLHYSRNFLFFNLIFLPRDANGLSVPPVLRPPVVSSKIYSLGYG